MSNSLTHGARDGRPSAADSAAQCGDVVLDGCDTELMPTAEHPMLPYLVDLETRFDVNAFRPYEPVQLVRYALGASDYWADLALGWLEEGVPSHQLVDELAAFEEQPDRPQALRHRARHLRKRG